MKRNLVLIFLLISLFAVNIGSASAQSSQSPAQVRPEAAAASLAVNGDFEQGPSVGWTSFSTRGVPVIQSSKAALKVPAHAGSWAAWLGGSNNGTTSIYQSNIKTPGDTHLRLWYWIDSLDWCGFDRGDVVVNGVTRYSWQLCSSTNTNGWVQMDLNLSEYVKPTSSLEIRVVTDVNNNSNLFIDDVVLYGSTVTLPYYMISGNAGAPGVALSYTDGTSKTVYSGIDGDYSFQVSGNWSGAVTPSHPCYTFNPTNRNFSNLTADKSGQDYTPKFNSAPFCAVTVGVFRPSTGALYLRNSNTTGYADLAINYGVKSDYPVAGDWNGDGTDTIGVYRDNTFLLRNSNTNGFADRSFNFGQPGDQPIAGDWNGDGVDTIGVYRPSTGQFFLRNNNASGAADLVFLLGTPGDVAIAGDWNGDGVDTVGVFRPSNGLIFLKNKNKSGFADITLNYGVSGDQPVAGDWDGDGDDTIGVYRNGSFYLRNSNTDGYADRIVVLGAVTDMPIAGNWDGLP